MSAITEEDWQKAFKSVREQFEIDKINFSAEKDAWKLLIIFILFLIIIIIINIIIIIILNCIQLLNLESCYFS